MNNIIAPTDFSSNAQNALEYAANLAAASKAKLFLLHVYVLPAIVDEGAVYLDCLVELDCQKKREMDEIVKRLQEQFRIPVEGYVYPGHLAMALPEFVKKHSGNLVVMGMHGANNTDRHRLGTVTSHFIKKGDFPILVIPSNVRFHPVQKILLAHDNQANELPGSLEVLKNLTQALKAEIKILHITKPSAALAGMATCEEPDKTMDSYFNGSPHSYSVIEDDDVVDGIYKSIKTHKPGFLAMMPRKRNFWQSLASGSCTQRISLNLDIPLLALSPNAII